MLSFLALSGFVTTAIASTAVPSGAIAVPLIRESNYEAYLAEFQVGTPPQKEYLEVDSGSPTISFENPKNDVCAQSSKPCAEYGTFVNTSSSTSRYVNSDFFDRLIDQGYGDTLTDNVILGGVHIDNLTFGYLDTYEFIDQVAVPTKTICGLALSCDGNKLDSSCYKTGRSGFFLIPQLYNKGIINTRAVSIYLGPEEPHVNNSQMILGGAYDKAKQGGKPFTVPMVPSAGYEMTDFVNVSAISSTIGGNVTRLELTPNNITLVDTGNPFLDIPQPLWKMVAKALGGLKGPGGNNGYKVDCKYRNISSTEKLSVEFGSSENVIHVPLSSLVVDHGNGHCTAPIGNNGPSSNGIGALADPFLRNTYITFNDDDFTVTMAQARYTQEQDIVPLPK